jgi:hypothetical protein
MPRLAIGCQGGNFNGRMSDQQPDQLGARIAAGANDGDANPIVWHDVPGV